MRILVLGGYGLIGMAVVRRLSGAGHQVIGLGRDVGRAQRVCPQAGWISADIAVLTTPEAWAPILAAAKADAIVNAAGVLQDGARDDVVRVQSAAMQALYRAAGPASVARFVQISATRATGDASTAFMRTKGEADAALRASSRMDDPQARAGPGAAGLRRYGASARARRVPVRAAVDAS